MKRQEFYKRAVLQSFEVNFRAWVNPRIPSRLPADATLKDVCELSAKAADTLMQYMDEKVKEDGDQG